MYRSISRNAHRRPACAERFIGHILEIANRENLPIHCHHWDLRQPLPNRLYQKYDCFFTDPPVSMTCFSL
ncbi:bis-aminopropyl spermidine synthase family protein [Brevibacillus invocatus]|uniref:bis-aminopropyl spermidine synthase family protein n=1 Tax=Brevibacillus invocatus TaxID=173959 RepID=UPI0039A1DA0A